MSVSVELLRGVVIVLAVISSYKIAQTCGGVSAGVKSIRSASVWVGLWTLVLTFLSSCAAALAGKTGIYGIELFTCVSSVTVGAYALYRAIPVRGRYVTLIYGGSLFLSVMLLMGEEGDFFRYLFRSAVYGGYFTSALLLFSRIRYRTDESEACECFRGLPVYLLSGAFLSCALHGILKVWEKLFT
ncbi:MAG: hypothetical protein IJO81_02800 [Clostridia bacterium]|nr:hypothetical protein [Clostridia bacterium]